jgi:hypothetical protein
MIRQNNAVRSEPEVFNLYGSSVIHHDQINWRLQQKSIASVAF